MIRILGSGTEGKAENQFAQPRGIGYDSKTKEIFVVDCNNHRIQVFQYDTLAFVRSIARPGAGQLNYSVGMSLDDHSQIYVADTNNHRIAVFNRANGMFLRSFGTKGSAPGQLSSPYGVCVDLTSEALFVTDYDNHRIQVFNKDTGEFLRMIGTGQGGVEGQLNQPIVMCIDYETDSLFVADYSNNRIQIFNKNNGQFLNEINNDFKGPRGLVIASEFLFVSDRENHRVQIFNKDTLQFIRTLGTGQLGVRPGQFNRPMEMCVNMEDGALLVVDGFNHRVQIMELPELQVGKIRARAKAWEKAERESKFRALPKASLTAINLKFDQSLIQVKICGAYSELDFSDNSILTIHFPHLGILYDLDVNDSEISCVYSLKQQLQQHFSPNLTTTTTKSMSTMLLERQGETFLHLLREMMNQQAPSSMLIPPIFGLHSLLQRHWKPQKVDSFVIEHLFHLLLKQSSVSEETSSETRFFAGITPSQLIESISQLLMAIVRSNPISAKGLMDLVCSEIMGIASSSSLSSSLSSSPSSSMKSSVEGSTSMSDDVLDACLSLLCEILNSSNSPQSNSESQYFSLPFSNNSQYSFQESTSSSITKPLYYRTVMHLIYGPKFVNSIIKAKEKKRQSTSTDLSSQSIPPVPPSDSIEKEPSTPRLLVGEDSPRSQSIIAILQSLSTNVFHLITAAFQYQRIKHLPFERIDDFDAFEYQGIYDFLHLAKSYLVECNLNEESEIELSECIQSSRGTRNIWRSTDPIREGDLLDCLDNEKCWFESFVTEVRPNGSYKVHYMGWGSKWDDVISPEDVETRISPLNTKTKNWRGDLFEGGLIEIKCNEDNVNQKWMWGRILALNVEEAWVDVAYSFANEPTMIKRADLYGENICPVGMHTKEKSKVVAASIVKPAKKLRESIKAKSEESLGDDSAFFDREDDHDGGTLSTSNKKIDSMISTPLMSTPNFKTDSFLFISMYIFETLFKIIIDLFERKFISEFSLQEDSTHFNHLLDLARDVLLLIAASPYKKLLSPYFCRVLIVRCGVRSRLFAESQLANILQQSHQSSSFSSSSSSSSNQIYIDGFKFLIEHITSLELSYANILKKFIRDLISQEVFSNIISKLHATVQICSMKVVANTIFKPQSSIIEHSQQQQHHHHHQLTSKKLQHTSFNEIAFTLIKTLLFQDRFSPMAVITRQVLSHCCRVSDQSNLATIQSVWLQVLVNWVVSTCEFETRYLSNNELEESSSIVLVHRLMGMLEKARSISRLEFQDTQLCFMTADIAFLTAFSKLNRGTFLSLSKGMAVHLSSLLDTKFEEISVERRAQSIEIALDFAQTVFSNSNVSDFQLFYQTLLSRRLLRGRFTSIATEIDVVDSLPVMSQASQMLREIEQTSTTMIGFRKMLLNKFDDEELLPDRHFEFASTIGNVNIHVLTSTLWPRGSLSSILYPDMKLPSEMIFTQQQFQEFYSQSKTNHDQLLSINQPKKRLHWCLGYGTVTLTCCWLAKYRCDLQIVLSEPQAIVLLAFNKVKKPTMTFSFLSRITGLNFDVLPDILATLADPSLPLIDLSKTHQPFDPQFDEIILSQELLTGSLLSDEIDDDNETETEEITSPSSISLKVTTPFSSPWRSITGASTPLISHPTTPLTPIQSLAHRNLISPSTPRISKKGVKMTVTVRSQLNQNLNFPDWRIPLIDAAITRILKKKYIKSTSNPKELNGVFSHELISLVMNEMSLYHPNKPQSAHFPLSSEDILTRCHHLAFLGIIEKKMRSDQTENQSIYFSYLEDVSQPPLETSSHSQEELTSLKSVPPPQIGKDLFTQLLSFVDSSNEVISSSEFSHSFLSWLTRLPIQSATSISPIQKTFHQEIENPLQEFWKHETQTILSLVIQLMNIGVVQLFRLYFQTSLRSKQQKNSFSNYRQYLKEFIKDSDSFLDASSSTSSDNFHIPIHLIASHLPKSTLQQVFRFFLQFTDDHSSNRSPSSIHLESFSSFDQPIQLSPEKITTMLNEFDLSEPFRDYFLDLLRTPKLTFDSVLLSIFSFSRLNPMEKSSPILFSSTKSLPLNASDDDIFSDDEDQFAQSQQQQQHSLTIDKFRESQQQLPTFSFPKDLQLPPNSSDKRISKSVISMSSTTSFTQRFPQLSKRPYFKSPNTQSIELDTKKTNQNTELESSLHVQSFLLLKNWDSSLRNFLSNINKYFQPKSNQPIQLEQPFDVESKHDPLLSFQFSTSEFLLQSFVDHSPDEFDRSVLLLIPKLFSEISFARTKFLNQKKKKENCEMTKSEGTDLISTHEEKSQEIIPIFREKSDGQLWNWDYSLSSLIERVFSLIDSDSDGIWKESDFFSCPSSPQPHLSVLPQRRPSKGPMIVSDLHLSFSPRVHSTIGAVPTFEFPIPISSTIVFPTASPRNINIPTSQHFSNFFHEEKSILELLLLPSEYQSFANRFDEMEQEVNTDDSPILKRQGSDWSTLNWVQERRSHWNLGASSTALSTHLQPISSHEDSELPSSISSTNNISKYSVRMLVTLVRDIFMALSDEKKQIVETSLFPSASLSQMSPRISTFIPHSTPSTLPTLSIDSILFLLPYFGWDATSLLTALFDPNEIQQIKSLFGNWVLPSSTSTVPLSMIPSFESFSDRPRLIDSPSTRTHSFVSLDTFRRESEPSSISEETSPISSSDQSFLEHGCLVCGEVVPPSDLFSLRACLVVSSIYSTSVNSSPPAHWACRTCWRGRIESHLGMGLGLSPTPLPQVDFEDQLELSASKKCPTSFATRKRQFRSGDVKIHDTCPHSCGISCGFSDNWFSSDPSPSPSNDSSYCNSPIWSDLVGELLGKNAKISFLNLLFQRNSSFFAEQKTSCCPTFSDPIDSDMASLSITSESTTACILPTCLYCQNYSHAPLSCSLNAQFLRLIQIHHPTLVSRVPWIQKPHSSPSSSFASFSTGLNILPFSDPQLRSYLTLVENVKSCVEMKEEAESSFLSASTAVQATFYRSRSDAFTLLIECFHCLSNLEVHTLLLQSTQQPNFPPSFRFTIANLHQLSTYLFKQLRDVWLLVETLPVQSLRSCIQGLQKFQLKLLKIIQEESAFSLPPTSHRHPISSSFHLSQTSRCWITCLRSKLLVPISPSLPTSASSSSTVLEQSESVGFLCQPYSLEPEFFSFSTSPPNSQSLTPTTTSRLIHFNSDDSPDLDSLRILNHLSDCLKKEIQFGLYLPQDMKSFSFNSQPYSFLHQSLATLRLYSTMSYGTFLAVVRSPFFSEIFHYILESFFIPSFLLVDPNESTPYDHFFNPSIPSQNENHFRNKIFAEFCETIECLTINLKKFRSIHYNLYQLPFPLPFELLFSFLTKQLTLKSSEIGSNGWKFVISLIDLLLPEFFSVSSLPIESSFAISFSSSSLLSTPNSTCISSGFSRSLFSIQVIHTILQKIEQIEIIPPTSEFILRRGPKDELTEELESHEVHQTLQQFVLSMQIAVMNILKTILTRCRLSSLQNQSNRHIFLTSSSTSTSASHTLSHIFECFFRTITKQQISLMKNTKGIESEESNQNILAFQFQSTLLELIQLLLSKFQISIQLLSLDPNEKNSISNLFNHLSINNQEFQSFPSTLPSIPTTLNPHVSQLFKLTCSSISSDSSLSSSIYLDQDIINIPPILSFLTYLLDTLPQDQLGSSFCLSILESLASTSSLLFLTRVSGNTFSPDSPHSEEESISISTHLGSGPVDDSLIGNILSFLNKLLSSFEDQQVPPLISPSSSPDQHSTDSQINEEKQQSHQLKQEELSSISTLDLIQHLQLVLLSLTILLSLEPSSSLNTPQLLNNLERVTKVVDLLRDCPLSFPQQKYISDLDVRLSVLKNNFN